MKTKRKMLRIFLMLFGLFWLGGQKAFAQDKYERNITLTSNFTVGLDELYSYLALEYGKGINRVSVKNGETFMININSLANFKEITYLCAKNNISYDEQSNQIKITGAGSFDFRYTTQISGQTEQEWDVIIDVNYFGVLQYGAGDAPEKIAVVGKNDPRVGETIDGYVYLSEEATLSVPFNFPSTKWFGVDNGINNSLETIILNGTHSVSLETLKSTGYSEFAVRFRDGTSNELSSGLGGGESWDNFKLIAAPTQYTIQATAKPSHGGTVTGTGTFEEGSEVKLIATANEGFVFKNWTENEVEVSNEASYSFTATENRELVANFKLKELKISATADPEVGGTVSGNGTYNYGDKVALVATPANGYHFVSWMEGADVVSTNASYTFTATTERTFVAKFEKVVIAPKITTTSLPNTQQNQAYDYQLTATGTAPLTWKISSGNLPQGLNLSSDGKISGTPTQDGSFNFTVQVSNSAGNDTKQFSITVVKEVITVSGVTLDKDALKLVEGNTATLIATISPADATNQAVTWESSDTNIASVDSNGKVTAIKAGTATISVKTNDGGLTASCKVTVIAPKPDTPTNLNISALYQREAEIAWDGGSASKWKVSYNNNDSIVTENKILLLGLIPGETCEATVQAISEQTESEAVKIAIPTHPLTTTEELVPHLWDEELPSGAEVRLIIKDCKSPIKTIKLTQGQTTSTIIGSYFTVGKEEIRIDLELEDGTVWELYYQTN